MPVSTYNEKKANQPLPPKEQGLFRKTVKCYEHKQYKNGLKFAKQILSNSKFAEHGETLSMKGLILNCMGKTEEAREHVKKGLMADTKSHVCWHVYGLFYRSEKKYDEAIKAYRNALRLDPDNMQILRDLSLLQIQMRDLEGYRDTRYQLLKLRPTQRASWIGYAMAYHLNKEYDMSLKLLTEFIKSQSPQPQYDFEHSELLLYQNLVLREAGKTNEALAHLNEHEYNILDKLSLLQIKGELQIAEGRPGVAAEIYRELIARNPENLQYYSQLEICSQLHTSENYEQRWNHYKQMQTLYPRASAPKRIPLTFLKGNEFKEEISKYLLESLRKGLPALFQQVRELYKDEEKVKIIEEVLVSYKDSLESSKILPTSETDELEVPTTLLWIYYFLGQHYDKLSQPTLALQYVDKAIEHTPTLIELYCLKAKIFKNGKNFTMSYNSAVDPAPAPATLNSFVQPDKKHNGALIEAVRCMDDAQSLDTADRFINSKCAKYMLRAGMVDQAQNMASKFSREGVSANSNLNEMQCMWYETECAHAFKRSGQLGDSLKKSHDVFKHFSDIEEDQFDFHTYCVRKMTLSAYVRLLRLEDSLRTHPFYFRAARLAIKIYLRLHDGTEDESEQEGGDGDKANSAAERRKAQRKKKKAAAKQQAIQEAKGGKGNEGGKGGGTQQSGKSNKDGDEASGNNQNTVTADELLKTPKPLDESVKIILPLLELKSDNIDAYVLGFNVYWRREKVLRMTQCLKRAHQIEPLYPKLHICKIRMLQFLEKNPMGESGAVSEIVNEELKEIFGSERNPTAFNNSFASENHSSYPHLLAAAECGVFLNSKNSPELVNAVVKAVEDKSKSQSLTFKSVQRALKLLRRGAFGGMDPVVIERYRDNASKIFPVAQLFFDIERLKQLTANAPGHDGDYQDSSSKLQPANSKQQQKLQQNGHERVGE